MHKPLILIALAPLLVLQVVTPQTVFTLTTRLWKGFLLP